MTSPEPDLLDLIAEIQAAPAQPSEPGQLSAAERFEAFHKANPAVFAALRHFALTWVRAKGNQPIGFPAIWERLRWEVSMSTVGGEPWKINNNYRSYYARLLMAREPTLAGLFEVRQSPADAWLAGAA